MATLDAGTIILNGDSSVSVSARKIINASLAMLGSSQSTVQGLTPNHGTIAILGGSSLAVTARKIKHGTISVSGTSSLTLVGNKKKHGTLDFTGASSVSCSGITIKPDFGDAIISGSSMVLVDLHKVTVKKKKTSNILIRSAAKVPVVRNTPSAPSQSFSIGASKTKRF